MPASIPWRARAAVAACLSAALSSPLFAAEHVTLKNGFELDCVRRSVLGDKVRLFFKSSPGAGQDDGSYLEVASDAILHIEEEADTAPVHPLAQDPQPSLQASPPASLTPAEMHQMLATAGSAHNIDSDLLASIVRAESHGQIRAVSRTGARGLMQLMPQTAADLGVKDSFVPEQNIAGGTRYLDALLTRYHDNIALAVAAYNAGPAAVDRYRGVPPYRETRAYVATVIREFNRRKQSTLLAKTP